MMRRAKRGERRITTDLALAGVVLLASVPRLAAALSRVDPDLLGVPIAPLTGLGTAAVFELGIFYMAHVALKAWKLRSYKAKFKMWWFLVPFILIELIAAPIIALPAGLSIVRGQAMSEVLGNWDWPWVLVAYTAPSLLVAGVSVAGAIDRRDWTKKDAAPTGEHEKKPKRPASPYVCTVVGCDGYGKDFGSQRALAGHCGGAAHKAAKEKRGGETTTSKG